MRKLVLIEKLHEHRCYLLIPQHAFINTLIAAIQYFPMDDLPHLLPDLDYLLNLSLHLSELLITFLHDLLKFLVRTKEL